MKARLVRTGKPISLSAMRSVPWLGMPTTSPA
jgi:hypothetical protein